jgi:MraZ protein
MFLGNYRHGFDDKGRLTVPAKLRELPESGVVIVQGLDHNLMVLPFPVFQILYDNLMAMNLMDPAVRKLRHHLLGTAQDAKLDGAGRILLAANLRTFAGLNSEVVFVGQGDYFEIWSAEKWEAEQTQENEAENAQSFAALNLATR